MVRKKLYTLVYALCFYAECSGAEAAPIEPKHVIFDFGCFVKPDKAAAAKQLGVLGIAASLAKGKLDVAATTKELFDVLKTIPAPVPLEENKENEDDEKIVWHNHDVPPVMKAWLKNKVPSKEVLEATQAALNEKYGSGKPGSRGGRYMHKRHMTAVSGMVFDPQQCAAILKPNAKFFKLARDLNEAGHLVHILGNWPVDVKQSILARFPEDFSQIKGFIVVSGELDAIKCRGNGVEVIYDRFLKKRLPNTPKEDVVLIEQTLAIRAEEEPFLTIDIPKGWAHIPAHPQNAPLLRDRLIKAGLLPQNGD